MSNCRKLCIDILLLIAAIIACLLGALSLYCNLTILSCIAIAAVDSYFFAVLLTAAVRADKCAGTYNNTWNAEFLFPSRRLGVVTLPLMAVALVIAFAGLYFSKLPNNSFTSNLTSELEALYFSLVTMTTVGYGDIAPLSAKAKWLVMLQIASGFLTLVTVFPLLISRVSKF